MTELVQPDPDNIIKQVEVLQDVAAGIVAALQSAQTIAQTLKDEFPEMSQETCEKGNAILTSLRRQESELLFRTGNLHGQLKYFVPEGMSEGDPPPCDC